MTGLEGARTCGKLGLSLIDLSLWRRWFQPSPREAGASKFLRLWTHCMIIKHSAANRTTLLKCSDFSSDPSDLEYVDYSPPAAARSAQDFP